MSGMAPERRLMGLIFLYVFLMGHIGTPAEAAERSVLIRLRELPGALAKTTVQDHTRFGIANLDAVARRYPPVRIVPVAPVTDDSNRLHKAMLTDPAFRWVKWVAPDSVDPERLLDELLRLDEVEAAELNRAFRLHHLPDDPLVGSQWALSRIRAFDAWEVERGKAEVLIAVIDSGIDYTHPDLVGSLYVHAGEDVNGNGMVDAADFNGVDDDRNGFVDDVRGWDFTDAPNYPSGGDYLERDNDPMDEMGHGTAVAGLIAAAADNHIGIAGLAPGCRILNLRSMNAGGYGEEDDVASAILYAVSLKAAVINMSWGDTFVTRLLDDVVRYAASQNVVLVASAGNSSSDLIHYPSGFEPVISVGASTAEDYYAASFTNYGPTIDLVAPGQEIVSTTLHSRYDSTLRGTSFSAPYVSAAAALVLSQHPYYSPTVVRDNLTATADDLGDPGWDPYYGAGRLNVYAALTSQQQANEQISSPWLDDGFRQGPIDIKGSAWSSSFSGYDLYYGIGDNPKKWSSIVTNKTQPVLDGFLGAWNSLPATDGPCILRLLVHNVDGSEQESRVRIFIDRTPPTLSGVELLPMLDADRHSVLIQYHTDDLSENTVYYRSEGVNEPFKEIPMVYRTVEPRLNFSQSQATGRLEIKLMARNGAGMHTIDDHGGKLYSVDLSGTPIDRLRYTPMNYSIPHGHLLDARVDFNQNRIPEIIIGVYPKGGGILCQWYEFSGDGFSLVASLPNFLVPRDIGDSNGNKKPELLAGYGFSTYLYENNASSGIDLALVKSWIGSSSEQYWGSRLVDVDGDERDEVILRVQKSADNTISDQFEIWKCGSDGQYVRIAGLANPTSGDNLNGVPHCSVGDWDGDGSTQILLGDSDGDLYMYERSGSAFSLVWQDRLPLQDAIEWTASGDFDGDGVPEFVAGCHSDPSLNSEHSYDARHWHYRIYDYQGENTYRIAAEWRFFGYESTKDFPCGVTAGDVDQDGRDEALITAYPDFYLAEWEEDRYQITFHAASIQGNGALLVDADHDGQQEFWISDGETMRPYRRVGVATAPPAPVGITVHPLDERSVQLTWYPVPGADEYLLYRGMDPKDLQVLQTVTAPAFLDTTVTSGLLYHYALACIDYEKNPNRSHQSAVYSARPGPKPWLLPEAYATERTVRLYFSEPLDAGAKDPTHYTIDGDLGRPTSCGYDKGGKEILLTLGRRISQEGRFTVTATGLMDLDGTPLDAARSSATFTVSNVSIPPYLLEATLISDQTVRLTFSESMDPRELLDPVYYEMSDGLQVASVKLVRSCDQVDLTIIPETLMGAFGKRYWIKVHSMRSQLGTAIQKGRGDMIQLIFSKFNLDDVYTFPNPYRAGLDDGGITFANLTIQADIRITTLEGRTLRILHETNGDGGVVWDGLDEQGRPLASGIYLYQVSNDKESKWGKFAIVR